MRAFITGLAGTELSDDEQIFLRDAQPWGLILFKRNVAAPQSLRNLIDDVRATLGWSAPVLIDQEGGRDFFRLGSVGAVANHQIGAGDGYIRDRNAIDVDAQRREIGSD